MTEQAVAPLKTDPQIVLRAMRRMLVIVAVFACVACGMAIWLYLHYIPMINSARQEILGDQKQIQEQWDQLAKKDNALGKMCYEMASRKFQREKDAESAGLTLDECMIEFPKDVVLPAYKAEVFTRSYSQHRDKGIYLTYALQAAAFSNQIMPNADAYEWQALAYCLKASFGPQNEAQQSGQLAINAFTQEFKIKKDRQKTIQNMDEFQSYCPAQVKNAPLFKN